MKQFMDKDFLLKTETARTLYYEIAADLPICDFHCHIPAQQIAENKPFTSITEVWLGGDHYKWRAERIAGVPEEKITGDASAEEKFMVWAETMPKLIGNPLYHWTHLELQRYFGIEKRLTPETAREIYDECNEKITKLRPQDLIRMSNVKLVCTTDDPVDTLEWHRALREHNESGAQILPAWRPDKALKLTAPTFLPWLSQLAELSGEEIETFAALKDAIFKRLRFFHENGCRLCDHGLDTLPAGPLNEELAAEAFANRLADKEVTPAMEDAYRFALLVWLSGEYSRLGWTMQLHIGAERNMNTQMVDKLGPDTGYDGIGDECIAHKLTVLMQAMMAEGPLPKTLLFTLNDKDNYTLGALAGAMQRTGVPALVNQGPAWWYHDQKVGMEKHMKNLAAVTPLSEFVGMTTDSRSLLSYTRHEYFRRILCNVLGQWVEDGEYPYDRAALEMIIRKICFENAYDLFKDVR